MWGDPTTFTVTLAVIFAVGVPVMAATIMLTPFLIQHHIETSAPEVWKTIVGEQKPISPRAMGISVIVIIVLQFVPDAVRSGFGALIFVLMAFAAASRARTYFKTRRDFASSLSVFSNRLLLLVGIGLVAGCVLCLAMSFAMTAGIIFLRIV